MDLNLEERGGVRLAIEGCGHGTLDAIYASVAEACRRKGWPGVDLLIIGGDFQSVRNAYDLNCVNMPAKYRAMCDFHKYYAGQETAPYLTIFVGGNHEASNYLFELYYGGWVAPNIYYMGAANVLRLGPLRIAGLSGIWKGYDYRRTHHERIPYSDNDLKSIYHVRELDVRKLLQIRTQVDVGISHDWPKGVEWKGNHRQLFRFKPHLEADAKNGQLGSVAAQQVMNWLRPSFWFSAHLHCKYAAVVNHSGDTHPKEASHGNRDEIELEVHDSHGLPQTAPATVKNLDEIDLDDTLEEVPQPATSKDIGHEQRLESDTHVWPYTQSLDAATAALPASFSRPTLVSAPTPTSITNDTTQFLALDKCLPGKHFLQLMSIPSEARGSDQALRLQYDPEWLAITRAFALSEPLEIGASDKSPPAAKPSLEYYKLIDRERSWVDENIQTEKLVIPENFQVTSPVYDGGVWSSPSYARVDEYPNPQTESFCQLLNIPNTFAITAEERENRIIAGPPLEPFSGRAAGGERGRRGNAFGRGRGGRFRGRGPRGGGR